jgi:hypothetical protein
LKVRFAVAEMVAIFLLKAKISYWTTSVEVLGDHFICRIAFLWLCFFILPENLPGLMGLVDRAGVLRRVREIESSTFCIYPNRNPQVIYSPYAVFPDIISGIAQEALEIFLKRIAKAIHEEKSRELRRARSEMIRKNCVR